MNGSVKRRLTTGVGIDAICCRISILKQQDMGDIPYNETCENGPNIAAFGWIMLFQFFLEDGVEKFRNNIDKVPWGEVTVENWHEIVPRLLINK